MQGRERTRMSSSMHTRACKHVSVRMLMCAQVPAGAFGFMYAHVTACACLCMHVVWFSFSCVCVCVCVWVWGDRAYARGRMWGCACACAGLSGRALRVRPPRTSCSLRSPTRTRCARRAPRASWQARPVPAAVAVEKADASPSRVLGESALGGGRAGVGRGTRSRMGLFPISTFQWLFHQNKAHPS